MEYRINSGEPENASGEVPYEMTAMQKAWRMLREAKKNVRVAVIVPPAVRVSIGEYFGLARGEDCFGKLASALRMIGADVVADGAAAVDRAVAEAVRTFARKKEEGGLPLILSSRASETALKEKYPALAEKLADFAPALTLAGLIKKYYNSLGDGKKTRVIIVAPAEVETDEDVLVLTARETAVMIQSAAINLRMLKASAADSPFVGYSGAGVLPAVSGGLAESIVRSLLPEKSEENFKKLEYSGLRGRKTFRKAEIAFGEDTLRVAVACDEQAVEALAEELAEGAAYDLAEIAPCAGGCIAEEGQPFADEMTEKLRAEGIYRLDRHCAMKTAEQNVAAAWLDALILAEPAPSPTNPNMKKNRSPL